MNTAALVLNEINAYAGSGMRRILTVLNACKKILNDENVLEDEKTAIVKLIDKELSIFMMPPEERAEHICMLNGREKEDGSGYEFADGSGITRGKVEKTEEDATEEEDES